MRLLCINKLDLILRRPAKRPSRRMGRNTGLRFQALARIIKLLAPMAFRSSQKVIPEIVTNFGQWALRALIGGFRCQALLCRRRKKSWPRSSSASTRVRGATGAVARHHWRDRSPDWRPKRFLVGSVRSIQLAAHSTASEGTCRGTFLLSRADLRTLNQYAAEFDNLTVRFLTLVFLGVLWSQKDVGAREILGARIVRRYLHSRDASRSDANVGRLLIAAMWEGGLIFDFRHLARSTCSSQKHVNPRCRSIPAGDRKRRSRGLHQCGGYVRPGLP